jgi:hypothetical protein
MQGVCLALWSGVFESGEHGSQSVGLIFSENAKSRDVKEKVF